MQNFYPILHDGGPLFSKKKKNKIKERLMILFAPIVCFFFMKSLIRRIIMKKNNGKVLRDYVYFKRFIILKRVLFLKINLLNLFLSFFCFPTNMRKIVNDTGNNKVIDILMIDDRKIWYRFIWSFNFDSGWILNQGFSIRG